jgi:hypothetical protein
MMGEKIVDARFACVKNWEEMTMLNCAFFNKGKRKFPLLLASHVQLNAGAIK